MQPTRTPSPLCDNRIVRGESNLLGYNTLYRVLLALLLSRFTRTHSPLVQADIVKLKATSYMRVFVADCFELERPRLTNLYIGRNNITSGVDYEHTNSLRRQEL